MNTLQSQELQVSYSLLISAKSLRLLFVSGTVWSLLSEMFFLYDRIFPFSAMSEIIADVPTFISEHFKVDIGSGLRGKVVLTKEEIHYLVSSVCLISLKTNEPNHLLVCDGVHPLALKGAVHLAGHLLLQCQEQWGTRTIWIRAG